MADPEDFGGDSTLSGGGRVLAESLQAAEGRVFPLAMVDADRYQRAVELIGLLRPVVAERASTIEELAACGPACIGQARDLASRNAISVADLDVVDIVDAARAQRLRELLIDDTRSMIDRRVAEARAAGLAWAAVAEPAPGSLGIAPEQRWVDLHIATGSRLVRTIRMNPTTGEAQFQVELRTADGQGMAIECASRAEWLELAEDFRASLEEVSDGTASPVSPTSTSEPPASL